jgi:hypothetical protein
LGDCGDFVIENPIYPLSINPIFLQQQSRSMSFELRAALLLNILSDLYKSIKNISGSMKSRQDTLYLLLESYFKTKLKL